MTGGQAEGRQIKHIGKITRVTTTALQGVFFTNVVQNTDNLLIYLSDTFSF
jgi:hypothetical protein